MIGHGRLGLSGGLAAALAAAVLYGCAAVTWPGEVHSDAEPAVRGEATAVIWFGAFTFGDAGIDAARRAAGIRRIAYLDRRFTSFLGIYSTSTTIVYGEPASGHVPERTDPVAPVAPVAAPDRPAPTPVTPRPSPRTRATAPPEPTPAASPTTAPYLRPWDPRNAD